MLFLAKINMDCFRVPQGRWLFYIGVVVIPSIVIYIVGLPVLAFVYIYRINRDHNRFKKDRSDSDKLYHIMEFRVGFLFSGFRRKSAVVNVCNYVFLISCLCIVD